MTMQGKLTKAENEEGTVTIPLSKYQELLIKEDQWFDMQDVFTEWQLLDDFDDIDFDKVRQIDKLVREARKAEIKKAVIDRSTRK